MNGKRRFAVAILVVLSARAWIDYDEKVERKEPTYGKEFRGFALCLSMKNVDFEQDSGEELRITLRNTTAETRVVADSNPKRIYALILVLADKNGGTRVSRNLLEGKADNPLAQGKLTPRGTTEILRLSFDKVRTAGFKEYDKGMPYVPAGTPWLPTSSLVPKLWVLRAILYSALPGKRPDFAVASAPWPILLRAKSGARMTPAERQKNLERWLKKMRQGAYGGIGVSSQLAALGEEAVDPLIAMAERPDSDGKTPAERQAIRESRIWAIVTLCNTGSPRAEAYILKRIKNPVDFGDLAFLTWHSQGFHQEEVTEELRQFAEDAVCGRPMPWERVHGPDSRHHGRGALEYVFKHFAAIHASITDATAAGLVQLDNPKLLAFGLLAWQPPSADKALQVLLPVFGRGPIHGNVKKAVLHCLSSSGPPPGFPAYDRTKDINRQWLEACLWLRRHDRLSPAAMATAMRWLALDIPRDNEELQASFIASVSRLHIPGYPVKTRRPRLPQDWVATWRWALRTSGIDSKAAIAYCTRMMRTRDELPVPVKTALLIELKRLIGAQFPLRDSKNVNVETAWPECGRWLVEQGYFRRKGG